MALVTSLEPNAKERSTVHGPTRCLYAIVEGPRGARYLQLDTVGSEDRAIPDKVSQSIQFDRQAAGQLLQLLHRTFPDLVPGSTVAADDMAPAADEEDEEGRMLLRLHWQRERKPRLVRRKKQSVLDTDGRLACDVCSFDFAATYGPLGEGFAECHHLTPLAALPGVTTTRLADLVIVCANCHRMLHRRPYHTVEQLREVVRGHRWVQADAETGAAADGGGT